ncbi:allantoicase [Thalassospira marina]|uniref:Probable allantoicase n=1 Tax=Thalassospira marina TaxID=2048283 RepID=A0A2N3KGQ6_9PROT|nr:allantoicase [Thalassospira marina]PKR49700.1 allantoicase [Thalassospira marina]
MSHSSSDTAPDFTRRFVNLADERLGAVAIFATDDFFADKQRMLQSAPAIFYPDKYDDNGKWMDGWESRRKRVEGHDYAIVRLATSGRIYGVDIDTSHFTGNFPPAASLEGCFCPAGDPDENADWTEIVAPQGLGASAHHYTEVTSSAIYTHVRLHIYPDGGIARLRVYGRPNRDWTEMAAKGEQVDLAAMINGGIAVAWSDAHYGNPNVVLAPGRGVNMGDGWETSRRREPGNEWLIIELGHPGEIEKIVIDTCHFKGNFPDRVSIQGAYVDGEKDKSIIARSMFWQTILPEQKMQADRIHEFGGAAITARGPVSHLRINSIPDGGISRIRILGKPAKP